MCKICPECHAIAEYNAYYGRITCTRCSWESEKITLEKLTNLENNMFGDHSKKNVSKTLVKA